MYIRRVNEADRPSGKKSCLLHGLALVGVRSVLGIENVSGSPFNVQRSLHVPNLVFDEVAEMFHCYEQESGQKVEQAVIDQVFYETRGQPGLTSWFGELLTETYNKHNPTITTRDFEIVMAATDALPNNNILNVISKARQEPYRAMVLEMFKTDEKIPFRYDNPITNFLYMNGVIDHEVAEETRYYVRFPCPFNLYMYLSKFLQHREGQVFPEFPTGNGKIDLLLEYAGQVYGLEVKSFVDAYEYKRALRQAAHYGQQLGLGEIALVFFVEAIDDANRLKYEAVYEDETTEVTVTPIFVATGT